VKAETAQRMVYNNDSHYIFCRKKG